MAHLFYLGRTMFCCGQSNKLSEMLMKLLNCVRLFRNFPKQYVHSQFWLKHVLHERTMKEIVLCNVYLLGEKGWSDGWIGAICPGGKCNGSWACPVWEYWEARPWPGRECIMGETWLGKTTSTCTLWPENSLGSISSAALWSSVDPPAREAFGRGARAPFRITS